ncbi:MAG: hypothetical protein KDA89_09685 [Planctomycetaceae bacterium]|nr:hypothetical protein [Planctomycetaceae bacterium]
MHWTVWFAAICRNLPDGRRDFESTTNPCCAATSMTMTNARQIASTNFREDDGSLPAVAFANISPEGVAKIYHFIAAAGRCVTESPTIRDDDQQADIPLMSVAPYQWLREGDRHSGVCGLCRPESHSSGDGGNDRRQRLHVGSEAGGRSAIAGFG